MPASNQPFLFFIKLPDLNELLTIHMEICCADQPSQRSLFHLKTLKCRELIFKEIECLASPVKFGDRSHIMAIISKTTFSSVEFRENRRQIGLDIVGIKQTTLSILQECLQYTCLVKLAPEWNMLQDILIEGQEFLETLHPLSSIKMDIFVSSNEITLCLQPGCVKLPPIRTTPVTRISHVFAKRFNALDSFYHLKTALKMEQFATPEQLSTSLIIQVAAKCHVLPSLKTATVQSISRSPGHSGAFKTYAEIQKHWKFMYGYLLPNVPEHKIWYFNVVFKIPNPITYTYPHFCVKPYGLIAVPRVDPRPILSAFIKTFCKKVGNVCGEQCRLAERKASFPEIVLFPAINISKEMKPRPGTTYAMKPNAPYRKDIPRTNSSLFNDNQDCQSNKNKFESNAAKNAGNHSAPVASGASLQSRNMKESKRDSLDRNQSTKLITSEKEFQETKNDNGHGNVFNSHLTSYEILSPLSQATPTMKPSETPQKKYAPCFYAKKPKNIKSSTSANNVVQPTLYAPKFVSKKRILNLSKEIVKKPILNSDDANTTIRNPKNINDEKCGKNLTQNKNIWSNFNVKKKLSLENDPSKVKKGVSKNKRKIPKESSSVAKKVTAVKK